VKRVRPKLLRWYVRERRDLPWRRTRDPYAIWISETMLQQTRVEAVIPYYERFLARFPDVGALASADVEAVYELWAGLGYYSRARNLHAAARRVVDEWEGRLPEQAGALRSLPGIGRYTAGAVASIAFDRPEPVVDGNVARVLARLRGIREDVRSPHGARRLWEEAAQLAAGARPGDLNQALMELGALVCTPRAPRCPDCPVASECDARRAGDTEALPVRPSKRRPRDVQAVAAWLPRRDRVLAVRRSPGGLLGGLWELPGGAMLPGEEPEAALRRVLRDDLGLGFGAAQPCGSVEHVFTHRRLVLHVLRCDAAAGRVRRRGFDGHRWLRPQGMSRLATGGPTRKALALLAGSKQADSRAGRRAARPRSGAP
jgi:A/G-specific adenine glycosylase